MLIDIFRWWLVVQIIGLLALPLTLWFFRRLPDRGYSFAKPFGLLLTGYGAWLLSMLGFGAFGSVQLCLMALLVGGLGIAVQGRAGLARAATDIRQRLAWIGLQEALFAVALYVGLALRWHQFWGSGGSISHTEQPMDLAFLSGILASPQFPPQDPWLSPYPINYYYLGYLLLAVIIRLSGVAIGVGFNLGMATIFALTATAVAGLVRNLIDLTTTHASSETTQEPTAKSLPASRLGRWALPLLGAVLVLIMGNQVAALQVLARSEKVVAMEPVQVAQAVQNGVGPRAPLDLSPPFPAQDFGDTPQLVPAESIENLRSGIAWWSSRAVWDDLRAEDGRVERKYNITEFPFFSFLLGDLHPHVLSLPWTLLAIALALNVLVRPSAPDFRTRSGWLHLVLTGIVLGGLYAINSWDLPTYLLLYLGALALLYLRLAGDTRNFFWAHFVQQAGATIMAAYFLYVPFHLSFQAPTQGFPLGIARARTGLGEFLIIFGLFFVPLLAYVITRAVELHQQAADEYPQWLLPPVPMLLLLAGLTLLGVVVGWPLFALMPLAVWACAIAYGYRRDSGTALALWMFAVGALVVWGVDLIFLRDDFGTRMNTIFKFYYQVWLMWGALTAYALFALLRSFRRASWLWAVPFLTLLLGASVYPVVAPADAPETRTLDGLAFLQRERPDEAAAIDWIRQNTRTDAVIVQAPGKPYRAETARIASATGRPTLIGWTQHERWWRGGQPELRELVAARESDVTTIYTTTDEQQVQSLLARYKAEYVLVGPNEQILIEEQGAPPEALAKFGNWMQPVFTTSSITIYGPR